MALRRCCAKFGLGLALWEKAKSNSATPSRNGFKKSAASATTNDSEKRTLTRKEWEKKFKKQQQADEDSHTIDGSPAMNRPEYLQ